MMPATSLDQVDKGRKLDGGGAAPNTRGRSESFCIGAEAQDDKRGRAGEHVGIDDDASDGAGGARGSGAANLVMPEPAAAATAAGAAGQA